MTDVLTRISAASGDLQHRLSHSRLPYTYALDGHLTSPLHSSRHAGLAFSLPTEASLPTPLAYVRPSYDGRSVRTDWFFGYAQDGYAASPRYRALVDDIATQLAIDRNCPARLLLHGKAAYIIDPFQDNTAQRSTPSSRTGSEPPYFGFLLEAGAIDALTTQRSPMTVHIISAHQGIPPF